MTCARDDGRDDTAPYWTALRKYNGAPLLRCVHPILDVGVGAAPLPRSERVYASSPLGRASRLFFLSFYLASSTALICPPRRSPFNSPGVLATILVVVLLFLFPSWSPRDPFEYPRCSPTFSTRDTGATARFRCTSMATSAHAQRTRCDAEGSFLASAPCTLLSCLPLFTLVPPRSLFCARRGGNRVQLKLRSRAHRSR